MSELTHILGYRAELILADADGRTFIVSGAIQAVPGVSQPTIDVERVAKAIDERNVARYQPAFREVKVTDA